MLLAILIFFITFAPRHKIAINPRCCWLFPTLKKKTGYTWVYIDCLQILLAIPDLKRSPRDVAGYIWFKINIFQMLLALPPFITLAPRCWQLYLTLLYFNPDMAGFTWIIPFDIRCCWLYLTFQHLPQFTWCCNIITLSQMVLAIP